jgi:hypothetical protein
MTGGDTTIVAGIEIPSTNPVFLTVVGVWTGLKRYPCNPYFHYSRNMIDSAAKAGKIYRHETG